MIGYVNMFEQFLIFNRIEIASLGLVKGPTVCLQCISAQESYIIKV